MDNNALFPLYALDDEEAAFKAADIARIYYNRKLKDLKRVKEKL